MLKASDLDRQFVALELQAKKALFQVRVFRFHQPLFNQREQACEGGPRVAMRLAKPVDLMLVPVCSLAGRLQISRYTADVYG